MTSTTTDEREQLAQETAEYIAKAFVPTNPGGGPMIVTRSSTRLADRVAPTTVDGIRTALLDGHVWSAWMDDRVISAMRELHPAPAQP